MSSRRCSTRRVVDGGSLVWGLVFAGIAALGIWHGLGLAINWRAVQHLAPLALMTVGVLGLLLNRHD